MICNTVLRRNDIFRPPSFIGTLDLWKTAPLTHIGRMEGFRPISVRVGIGCWHPQDVLRLSAVPHSNTKNFLEN